MDALARSRSLRFNRLCNPEFELVVIICLALYKASLIELPVGTTGDEVVVERPLTSLDGVAEFSASSYRCCTIIPPGCIFMSFINNSNNFGSLLQYPSQTS